VEYCDLKQPNDNHLSDHFSDELWVDFVRGLTPDRSRARMQAHLEGCADCQAVVEQFSGIVRFAAEERSLVVPPDLVLQASDVYQAGDPADLARKLQVMVAELISETKLGLQLAGVRSAAGIFDSGGVRLMYRAGDYSINVTIESSSAGGVQEIIGQISNVIEPDEPLEGIAVQITARGRILDETHTTRFGEFLIGYPLRTDSVLQFMLGRRGQRVDLPLGAER
jgi:hypothetical protein